MIYHITMKNNNIFVLNLKYYLTQKSIDLNTVLKNSFAIDPKNIAEMVVKY